MEFNDAVWDKLFWYNQFKDDWKFSINTATKR